MSRYAFQKQAAGNGATVAYGFDHAMGYFYQEEDGGGDLIVNLDSFFNELTGVHLAERLCGGEIALTACLEGAASFPTGVNPRHVHAMMQDLPF